MLEKVQCLIDKEYEAQKSEAWLELRGRMLTASDVATAIGVNPYSKPRDLILQKCGHNKFHGNAATEHGEKYEDEARDIYCAKYGEICHEIGCRPHSEYNWLGGSPDGITESGKLVEIKCPLRREITPEVPVHYMPQLQLLMEILDLDKAVFIQYKPSDITWPKPAEFVVTEVPRDREWFKTNLPIMDELWKKVLWHRQNGVESLMKPPPKTRKKKTPAATTICEIEDCQEDYPNVLSAE